MAHARILSSISTEVLSLDPVFADMTGDGKADLILGNSEGSLSYAENISFGNVVAFGPLQQSWQGINVGIQSSPAVADVNGDGLPDLLVGERAGNINLFINRGVATAPEFGATADDEFYGQIDVRLPGLNSSALSRPAVVQLGGEQLLYVGTGQGRLLVYGDLPAAPGATATLRAEVQTRVGDQIDPAFTGQTIAGSPAQLVWLGNQRGGFSAFQTELGSSTHRGLEQRQLAVYPNPNNGSLQLKGLSGNSLTYVVYDMLGRQVSTGQISDGRVELVLPQGVYILRARALDTGIEYLAKIVVE